MIEGKYAVDIGEQNLVLSMLNSLCPGDSEHPCDHINSIYYDTVGLDMLDQKISSDYQKSKVRLRWYGRPSIGEQKVPAYMEIKRKDGTQRSKSRQRLELRGDILQPGKESFADVAAYVASAAEMGATPLGPLVPLIVVRYLRHRFQEPLTGSRISLDTGIMFSRVNGQYVPECAPRALNVGVLEIKSTTGDIPSVLKPLKSRVHTRDSFSKYEECWGLYCSTSYRRELTSSRYD